MVLKLSFQKKSQIGDGGYGNAFIIKERNSDEKSFSSKVLKKKLIQWEEWIIYSIFKRS